MRLSPLPLLTLVGALLATATAGHATCAAGFCVSTGGNPLVSAGSGVSRSGTSGSYEPWDDEEGGDPCLTEKLDTPKPFDWNAPDNGAPYVFWRTQAWGYAYPNEYTHQFCVLPIVPPVGGGMDDVANAVDTVYENLPI